MLAARFRSGSGLVALLTPEKNVMSRKEKTSCLYRGSNSADPACKVIYWIPIPGVHKFFSKIQESPSNSRRQKSDTKQVHTEVKVKIRVKFTLEQTMKAQRRSRGIGPLLYSRR